MRRGGWWWSGVEVWSGGLEGEGWGGGLEVWSGLEVRRERGGDSGRPFDMGRVG